MSFLSAIQTCFVKYATFHGRARRSEYWFFVLFIMLIGVAEGVLDGLIIGASHTAESLKVFSGIS